MLLIASKTSRFPLLGTRQPPPNPSLYKVERRPIVAETQTLLEQRDDMGIRPRFSPYWETAVHMLQRIIAAMLTGAELD